MASDQGMFVDANSINKQYNLHVRIRKRATFPFFFSAHCSMKGESLCKEALRLPAK